MAGTNFGCRKKMLERTCNVVFEGGISPNTRSSLVCEFLKHVIFQRDQIPLPVDHLKRDIERLEKSESRKVHIGGKKAGLKRIEHRKAKEVVHAVDQLKELVQSAFHNCPDIRQLLIVLGGTPVSPKEMYLITFPAYYPDLQPLSSKAALKTLFRQLISSDFVNAPKPLSTTNTILLVNAPRDSPLSSFHSKCHYKLPNRGALYQMEWSSVQDDDCDMEVVIDYAGDISGIQPLNLSNMNDVVIDDAADISGIQPLNLSNINEVVIDDAGDISGIQPLDLSNMNMPVGECDCPSASKQPRENNQISATYGCDLCMSQTASELTPLMEDEGIHSLSDEEYIWFQAPVVIKGFRDRTSKKID